jgi:hypothetical protein
MEGATKSFPTTNSRNFGRIARDIASDMVATCRGLVATQPHHMCREERIGCPLQTTHPDASLTHRACSLETQWLATLPRFRLRRTGMSDYFAPGREPQPLPHHLGLPHTWEAFRSMGHAPLLYDAWPGGLGLGECDGFTLLLGPGGLRCCVAVFL